MYEHMHWHFYVHNYLVFETKVLWTEC